MEYESPSAAYSGTLQSILMKREEKQQERQRQSMLDQHKIEMDRAENTRAERELELRHQEMQERQQDRRQSQQDRQALNASQIEQRQQAKYDKTVAGMKPGDVMTPDMARASVSLGEQSDLMNPKQGLRDFMETLPQGSPARTGVAAQVGTPSTEQMVQTNTPLRFVGSPAQRTKAAQDKEQEAFVSRLPTGSPARQAYEAERVGLKTPPNTFTTQAEKTPVKVTFHDVKTGKNVEKYVSPEEARAMGQMESPVTPHDTSARDLSRMDRSYQLANKSLEDMRKPISDQAARFDRLVETVNQGTPQADALIAPELLTVMAGGQNSGLRMNEAEIARIIGGRSNFEGLKAAVNKWQTDPTKALSVTPAQRSQIRDLMAAVKKRSDARLDLINEASSALLDAPDVDTHRRVVSNVRKAIDMGTSATVAPKRTRYDINGNVLPD